MASEDNNTPRAANIMFSQQEEEEEDNTDGTPTTERDEEDMEAQKDNVKNNDNKSFGPRGADSDDSDDNFVPLPLKVKKSVTMSILPPVVIDDLNAVEGSTEMRYKQDYLEYEDPENAVRRIDSVQTQSSNVTDLFKGLYSERECYFVICAGVMLTFNSGFVNGACLTGLLNSAGVKKSVAGFTSAYSKSALYLADGEFYDFGTIAFSILSFSFGAFLAGFLTPDATPYRIEPTYGPTFLIGGGFLLAASLLAAFGNDDRYFFFFASAAIGIQNGISSIYTSNLVRSTGLTGTTTDMAVFVGQMARGNYKNSWKLSLLASLTGSFWTGGFLSVFATRRLTSYCLLFNAALFLAIGAALVAFLVSELHISVQAAMLGNWQWKHALEKLQKTADQMIDTSEMLGCDGLSKTDIFMQIFDKVDSDNSGTIEEDELLDALKAAGVKIKRKQVKVMMQQADTDGDGKISREEWMDIAVSLNQGGPRSSLNVESSRRAPRRQGASSIRR